MKCNYYFQNDLNQTDSTILQSHVDISKMLMDFASVTCYVILLEINECLRPFIRTEWFSRKDPCGIINQNRNFDVENSDKNSREWKSPYWSGV